MEFFKWLENEENRIKRFADFISIMASCFAIFASIAAIVLLVITIFQISNAADSLKANTIYSIAKDGRELSERISKMKKSGDFKPGYVFNYTHSVWQQKRLGTLDDRLWTPIENEICLFLRHNPKANSYWTDDTRKLFDPEFVKDIKKVADKPECKDTKGG